MNNEDVIILTLIIQVAIQLALYLGTCKIFRALVRKPIVTCSALHKIWGMERQAAANTITGAVLLGYNLLLSTIVLHFTDTSAIAGITNMGASVLIALIMFVEFSKFGRFYIEVPKKSAWQNMLDRIIIKKGEEHGNN